MYFCAVRVVLPVEDPDLGDTADKKYKPLNYTTMVTKVLLMATALLPVIAWGQKVDTTPVSSFQVDKFLGSWYEIARFDHGFERGMDMTTARYSLTDDGKIKVVNSGVKDGKVKTSIGKAKLTETQGLLRVSFFGPFYSDYRVLMVSDDYKYALIGSKSAKYLWILARTPQVPDDVIEKILFEARSRGYDLSELIWIKH